LGRDTPSPAKVGKVFESETLGLDFGIASLCLVQFSPLGARVVCQVTG
jgi:hypothetical protein